MTDADLTADVGTYTGKLVGSIATFGLCLWVRTDRGEENRIDGPHRPSFTLVAETEAPTWPTLRQKKVELRHAPVPRYKN